MLGAVAIVIVLLLLPVFMFVGGGVFAAVFGWSLKNDGDARYEGSELIELNR